jgi:hypothetical protein
MVGISMAVYSKSSSRVWKEMSMGNGILARPLQWNDSSMPVSLYKIVKIKKRSIMTSFYK